MSNICIPKGRNVEVCKSGAYYIGTFDEDGPYCRLSQEYYKTREEAQEALDNRTFTERTSSMEIEFCRGGCASCLK